MTARQVSQWRTVGLVVAGLFALGLGFYWSAQPGAQGVAPELVTARAGLFSILRDGIFLLVATGAGKSAVEHLAGGGGIRGAARALFTDAKPGDPAPETKP